jgi:hypothetical protein
MAKTSSKPNEFDLDRLLVSVSAPTVSAEALAGEGLEDVVPAFSLPTVFYLSPMNPLVKKGTQDYDKNLKVDTFAVNNLPKTLELVQSVDDDGNAFIFIQLIGQVHYQLMSTYDGAAGPGKEFTPYIVEKAPAIRSRLDQADFGGQSRDAIQMVVAGRQQTLAVSTEYKALVNVICRNNETGEIVPVVALIKFDSFRESAFRLWLTTLKTNPAGEAIYARIHKLTSYAYGKGERVGYNYKFEPVAPANSAFVLQAKEVRETAQEHVFSSYLRGGTAQPNVLLSAPQHLGAPVKALAPPPEMSEVMSELNLA